MPTVTSGRKTLKETSGLDIFNIGGDATSVTIAGKMKSGDIINVEGLASEYRASASGRTITLKSDTQTIKFQLDGTNGAASIRFLDGGRELTLGTQLPAGLHKIAWSLTGTGPSQAYGGGLRLEAVIAAVPLPGAAPAAGILLAIGLGRRRRRAGRPLYSAASSRA